MVIRFGLIANMCFSDVRPSVTYIAKVYYNNDNVPSCRVYGRRVDWGMHTRTRKSLENCRLDGSHKSRAKCFVTTTRCVVGATRLEAKTNWHQSRQSRVRRSYCLIRLQLYSRQTCIRACGSMQVEPRISNDAKILRLIDTFQF